MCCVTPPNVSIDRTEISCCILLLLVPKMVLTLCNLHWWCFFVCDLLNTCTNILILEREGNVEKGEKN